MVWNKVRKLFTRKTDAEADETPSGRKRHSRKGSRHESVRGNRRSHRSTAEDEITEDDRFNEPGEFTEVEEERSLRNPDGRRYVEADEGGREEGSRDSVELHESTRQSASLRRRSSRDYEIESERAPGPRNRGESWNEVGARARSRTSSVVGSPRKGRSSIGFREPPMVSGPDIGRNEKVQYVKRSYEEGRGSQRRSPEIREAHARSDEKDDRSPKTRRSSVVPRRLTQQVSLPRSEPGYRASPRRKPTSSYEDEGRARSTAHSRSSSRSGRSSPRALSSDQNAPRARTLSTKSAEIPVRHSQHQRRHLTMSDDLGSLPSPRGSDGSYSPRRLTTRRLAVNGSRLAAESGSHSSSEERSRSTVTSAPRDRYRGDLRAGDYPSREAPPVVKLSLQSLKKKAAEGRTLSRVRLRADVAVDEPVYEWGTDGEEDAELDRPAFMKPQYYV